MLRVIVRRLNPFLFFYTWLPDSVASQVAPGFLANPTGCPSSGGAIEGADNRKRSLGIPATLLFVPSSGGAKEGANNRELCPLREQQASTAAGGRSARRRRVKQQVPQCDRSPDVTIQLYAVASFSHVIPTDPESWALKARQMQRHFFHEGFSPL